MRWQARVEPPGDVVELGVYQGRSAIHIGQFVRPGETFTVCDLFEDAQTSEVAPAYVRRAYATLTQQTFEQHYLRFHDELPVVVRGPTSEIADHVPAGSCRFVHIDASHLYDDVLADTKVSHSLLRQSGVVVFDDFRHVRTLGTAAAVWEAVATLELVPICASASKLYATWGDPSALQDELTRRFASRKRFTVDTTTIRGRPVLRIAQVGAVERSLRKPARPTWPTAPHLRLLAEVGFGLSRIGYRMTRLAVQERPGAAALASIERKLGRLRNRVRQR